MIAANPKPSRPVKDRYIEGYLAGQVAAYCEMVVRGVRLAGQITLPTRYVKNLRLLIAQEGCKAKTQRVNAERTALWIYRDSVVPRLINSLQSASDPPSASRIWGVGKLFGYGDGDVVRFIERSM